MDSYAERVKDGAAGNGCGCADDCEAKCKAHLSRAIVNQVRLPVSERRRDDGVVHADGGVLPEFLRCGADPFAPARGLRDDWLVQVLALVEDSVATARTPESAGATTTEEVSLPPAPTTPATSEAPAPERPSGEVPSDLIGRWVGGEGSRSGYTLTFWADGRYQLSHDRSTGIPQFVERGLAGGKGYEIVLRPVEVAGSVERIERRARWSVQKAPDVYGYDIEVLVLVDIYGEFSYVKDE